MSTGKEALKSGLDLDPTVAAAYEENWGKAPPKLGDVVEAKLATMDEEEAARRREMEELKQQGRGEATTTKYGGGGGGGGGEWSATTTTTTTTAAEPASPLPWGWQEVTGGERVYYWNTQTNHTQYERPT